MQERIVLSRSSDSWRNGTDQMKYTADYAKEKIMNTVKELRHAAKMSQNKFAAYLGIPVSNIQNNS